MASRATMVLASAVLLSGGFVAGYFVQSDVLSPPDQQNAVSQPTGQIQLFRDCDDCPEMLPVPGQSFAAGRFEITRGQPNDQRLLI